MIDELGGSATAICSRAGCRAPATKRIVWRNPRIHDAARRKIWLACDAHVEYLRDYLAARRFPVAVEPFGTGRRSDPAS